MPVRLRTLREAAAHPEPETMAKSLMEAHARAQKVAFLCHSHRDQEFAKGYQRYLAEKGWDGYLDWEDTAMPGNPSRQTAEKIKRKIDASDLFLFLATPNSMTSRWCPWEIGYADKTKSGLILIVRTIDDAGNYHGNEYLQLYDEI